MDLDSYATREKDKESPPVSFLDRIAADTPKFETPTARRSDRSCAECQKNFNSPLQAEQHYGAASHRDRMRTLRKQDDRYGAQCAKGKSESSPRWGALRAVKEDVEDDLLEVDRDHDARNVKSSGAPTEVRLCPSLSLLHCPRVY